MKLVLFIHSLARGGAERDMAEMANHWVKSGRDVTLLTLAGPEDDTFPLDPGVRRIGLGLMHRARGRFDAIRWNLRRWRAVRRTLRELEPDAVVSFVEKTNVLALASALFLKIPVIVSERVDPRAYSVGRGWNWLRRILYPKASALVVMTESVRRWGERIARRRPVFVIPNPARKMPVTSPAASKGPVDRLDPKSHCILGMGRLNPQKGFDLLIDAFSRIAPKHPDWRLEIYGEGDERPHLERQIEMLGLTDRVFLPGWTLHPGNQFATSDLFVLSSRFEGYGNVLAEAMAAGMPVVSFDCDSGPSDIIRQGIDGILVPKENVEQLAATIDLMCGDGELRRRLAAKAPEVLNRFSEQRFFQQWDEVFRVVGIGGLDE